ncbi:hypothetical protein SAMN02910357_02048 [Succinivibrio dextrinosolvens]|nr:hypothetical protein SAMN02910357_02048 [Succinivibrio dextrinosolvens]
MPGFILTIVGFISLFISAAIIGYVFYDGIKSCKNDKEEK